MKAELQQFTVSEIERMAVAITKSGLFGVRSIEQAMALMLLSQAEGLHPVVAARDYHIIDGRPALRADAMLARFQQAGGRVEWHSLDDSQAEATFSHPQAGGVRIRWDIARAGKAGLLNKPGKNWERYPRAMLRARVISEGVRTVYPGIIVGVYTPEEVMEFSNEAVAPAARVAIEATASQERTELPEPVAEAAVAPSEPAPAASSEPTTEAITGQQLKKLQTILTGLGFDSSEERRLFVSWLVGRALESSRQLTRAEASIVLENLDSPQAAEILFGQWLDSNTQTEETPHDRN